MGSDFLAESHQHQEPQPKGVGGARGGHAQQNYTATTLSFGTISKCLQHLVRARLPDAELTSPQKAGLPHANCKPMYSLTHSA